MALFGTNLSYSTHRSYGFYPEDVFQSYNRISDTVGSPFFHEFRNFDVQDAVEKSSFVSKDGFQVLLDVQHFQPNEITVTIENNQVVVNAKHEEKRDIYGFISRKFTRRYKLPNGFKSKGVTSTLSSDGFLTVKASRHDLAVRQVQIQQTGPALLNIVRNVANEDDKTDGNIKSGRSLNLDKLENTLDHRQSTEKNHTQFMPTSSKLITANNGAKGPIIKPKTSTESIANPTDLGLLTAAELNAKLMALKSQPMSLYDFPDEILLLIFAQLVDIDLLDMARVCERFENIAKEVFAKKFSGKTKHDYFVLRIYSSNELEQQTQYQPFFDMFGEQMSAIKIQFIDDSVVCGHWVIGLMKRCCPSLAKIDITSGCIDLEEIIGWLKPTLTHLSLCYLSLANYDWIKHKYPRLVHLNLSGTINLGEQHLIEFLQFNNQIEDIYLDLEFDGPILAPIQFLESFNGKPFKSLFIHSFNPIELSASAVIEMRNLASCKLSISEDSIPLVLSAIGKGCPNLRKLEVRDLEDYDWTKESIKDVCQFKKLQSLKLSSVEGLTYESLSIIIKNLPNLSTLYLVGTPSESEIFRCIPDIVRMCKNFTYLHMQFYGNVEWNMDCLETMAEVTKSNQRMLVKLTNVYNSTYIAAKGVVRFGKGIIYWDGYEPSQSSTGTTLLDLTDECLEKIIAYLNGKSCGAFYNTCTKTQKAVESFIFNHQFNVRGEFYSLDSIMMLKYSGKHIRSMDVHALYTNRRDTLKLWENINRYCTQLSVLTIGHVDRSLHKSLNLSWPTITKLKWADFGLDYEVLRSIDCPKLTHLEISNLQTENNNIVKQMKDLKHAEAFQHLTVLKFENYNKAVHHFLSELNETTCCQMKELSINTLKKSSSVDVKKYLKLINVLGRFRNLTTLRLLIPEIQLLDTRFLFRNIPHLINLAVVCVNPVVRDPMWEHIKESCSEIKSIRVIGLPKDLVFDSTFMEDLSKRFREDTVKFFYKRSWCKFIAVPIQRSIMARDLFS